MAWTDSLIRISNYEVENLQKRLSEIVDRRTEQEVRLAVVTAEGEAELLGAQGDAAAGWYLIGYREGLKQRKATIQERIDEIGREEAGARDALAEAFEALKKYEQVAEGRAQQKKLKEARLESAAYDELGLRMAAGGR